MRIVTVCRGLLVGLGAGLLPVSPALAELDAFTRFNDDVVVDNRVFDQDPAPYQIVLNDYHPGSVDGLDVNDFKVQFDSADGCAVGGSTSSTVTAGQQWFVSSATGTGANFNHEFGLRESEGRGVESPNFPDHDRLLITTHLYGYYMFEETVGKGEPPTSWAFISLQTELTIRKKDGETEVILFEPIFTPEVGNFEPVQVFSPDDQVVEYVLPEGATITGLSGQADVALGPGAGVNLPVSARVSVCVADGVYADRFEGQTLSAHMNP